MIDQKLIDRINELAKLSKVRKLTDEELVEQTNLRKEYVKQFRAGFRQHLEGIRVVDESGNDVTPIKKGEA